MNDTVEAVARPFCFLSSFFREASDISRQEVCDGFRRHLFPPSRKSLLPVASPTRWPDAVESQRLRGRSFRVAAVRTARKKPEVGKLQQFRRRGNNDTSCRHTVNTNS